MSSGLVDLLGSTLFLGTGPGCYKKLTTADALKSTRAVALYFSAHWCPPCRGFTPHFVTSYTEDLKEKGLEVIFVSSDKDEDAFENYFGEMPWLSIPYADRSRKEALTKRFKVRGIPAVIVLDESGTVITTEGRTAICCDPKGDDFPWWPKPAQELLARGVLLSREGPVGPGALDGKVLGVFFGAHWCMPCRSFSSQLAGWYAHGLRDKGLEIVFVSSDADQVSFAEYYKEQPWLALDFASRNVKDQLTSLFCISEVPCLVIVDKDGSVITKEGREEVCSDPGGVAFPWHPRPVYDLARGPGSMQQVPTIVAMCEAAEDAAKTAAEVAMTPLACKYRDAAKASGEDHPEVFFAIAKVQSAASSRLRRLMGMPQLAPPPHPHLLEPHAACEGPWVCDGCQREVEGGYLRGFRCTQGCDFDYCEECHCRAGSRETVAPRLMLVDSPNGGGFYEGPKGEITAETVQRLLADFLAGRLEWQQLR